MSKPEATLDPLTTLQLIRNGAAEKAYVLLFADGSDVGFATCKFILTILSDYFRSYFSTHWKDAQTEVDLRGVGIRIDVIRQ